jgi:hypothetical protein
MKYEHIERLSNHPTFRRTSLFHRFDRPALWRRPIVSSWRPSFSFGLLRPSCGVSWTRARGHGRRAAAFFGGRPRRFGASPASNELGRSVHLVWFASAPDLKSTCVVGIPKIIVQFKPREEPKHQIAMPERSSRCSPVASGHDRTWRTSTCGKRQLIEDGDPELFVFRGFGLKLLARRRDDGWDLRAGIDDVPRSC